MPKSATRRSQIMEVSAALFRDFGYASTSMYDIADKLSIKPASLYNHIQSKQEILQHILISKALEFTAGMNDIVKSSLNPLEKLQKVIGLHVRMTIDYTDEMALFISEWKHLKEKPYRDFIKMRNAYDRNFRRILKDCREENLIKSVHIDVAMFSILSTLRYLYAWYDRNRQISSVELEKQLYQSLVKGLI